MRPDSNDKVLVMKWNRSVNFCGVNNHLEIYRSGKLVLLKNSSTVPVASDGTVGMDSSRLLRGLGANGAWPSLALAARGPA